MDLELRPVDALEHEAVTIDQLVVDGERFPLGAEAPLRRKVA